MAERSMPEMTAKAERTDAAGTMQRFPPGDPCRALDDMIGTAAFRMDLLLEAQAAGQEPLLEFRDEVRAFCSESLPADIRRKVLLGDPLSKSDHLRWHRILADKGWMAGHWPKEHGGLGWSRLQRWVFENEVYRAGSPWLIPFGVTYVGPVLIKHGTAEQKAQYLPATATSQIWWAQGYSEPGAGSDLASLRTTARRDGDIYRVNGQKVWTTLAHWADMMFTLVRTDPDAAPQRGISFLLIDLKSPGVEIRPIATIDGEHHVNEVFLNDVEVPVENLVGEEGRGWTYAKELLNNERLLAAEVGKAQRMMAQLKALLDAPDAVGTPRLEMDGWRSRLASLAARTISLECLAYGFFAEEAAGNDPGPAASTLKIIGAELLQSISAATLEVLSHYGLPHPQAHRALTGTAALDYGPGMVAEYLYGRAYSIYGGSSEIQRNILSKMILGL